VRRPALACAVALAALTVPALAVGAVGIASSTSVSTMVTLNGLDQQAVFDTTLTVTGGGGTGWKITAWAPKPTSGSNSLSALYVASAPTATCTGNKCVRPTPTGISWPVTLGTTSSGAVKIYNAAAGTGTATDPIDVPFAADVAANTLTGSYTTTITVAISNGP
jgi:hypothetical protein